jgi:hypothetical protein
MSAKLAKGTSQKSALKFIRGYLREQNLFIQRYASAYKLQKQSVLEIASKGSVVTITTSGFGPDQRRRYRLRRFAGNWKLTGINLECPPCYGSGTLLTGVPCVLCKATGWMTA